MKKLLILLFSLLISFNSYGEWTRIWSEDGDNYYFDYDSLKINNEYVYIWGLVDYLKPFLGDLSAKRLYEIECGTSITSMRARVVARSYFDIPMGEGYPSTTDNVTGFWSDFSPESEKIFANLCK